MMEGTESSNECPEIGQSEGQDNEVDDNVIVFQCQKCRRIVGDSTAWITANHSLKIIALYGKVMFIPIYDLRHVYCLFTLSYIAST